MKRTVRLISAITVFVLAIFLSSACDTYQKFHLYPEFKADAWYCEELDCEIRYHYNSDGILIDEKYDLSWGETVYSAHIGFGPGHYSIACDWNENNNIDLDEILLEGGWEYQSGNIVMEITIDNLTNGKLKELIFVPIE